MSGMVWIKITTDVFDDEAIKLIDAMPERDAILVIWFKLLCLAGANCGNGVMVFKDRVPYTDEMLSNIFHRPLNTVRLAMDTFTKFGMIERIDDTYIIPLWDKYQGSEKLDRIREQNAARQRRFKERQRQKLIDVSAGEDTSNVTNNVMVTAKSRLQNKNKNKNKNKDIYTSSESRKDEFCEEVISYLNAKIGSSYRSNSKKTKSLINARKSDGFTLDDFKTVIDKKTASWLNDSQMAKYLRPETLFGTKFEGYLNEVEANTASFTGDLPSEGGEGGWLHTVSLTQ